jgi:hypothetical protein
MCNSLLALAVVFGIALSQSVSAKDLTFAEPAPNAGSSSLRNVPELLHQFGIHLISKARAAECTQEGEICTSSEQCCAGLECSGGPPATCTTED